jgi:hypothetical protein
MLFTKRGQSIVMPIFKVIAAITILGMLGLTAVGLF